MASDVKYLIFGTGALGSVFGGFLQKSGQDVTYVGLGSHFEKILDDGLIITGIWGDHKIDSINGTLDYKTLRSKFDIILLCVKSTHTKTAAKQAATLLKDDGIMVSIQNGLNNWEIIEENVGSSRTVGGRVIFGVENPVDGTVKVTVYADKVLLGPSFKDVNEMLLERLVNALNKAKIPTEKVSKAEIWAAIWGKVLYNCALNPLGAILEVPYGKLGEREDTRRIMQNIIREIFEVIHAKGVQLSYNTWKDYYDFFMEKQLPPTSEHHSSMFQDIKAGRQTEIMALNGAVSEYAKELGINTPYNDMITGLIQFKETL